MGFHYESEIRSDPTVYAAVTKLKSGEITDILPLLDPPPRSPWHTRSSSSSRASLLASAT